MGFQAKMPQTKETRNRSRFGAPMLQNPNMEKSVGFYPSQPKPTLLLKGPSVASSLENSDKRTSKNNISYKYMNKSNLSKLTKNQLIQLLLNRQAPKPAPRTKWRDCTQPPIPFPRKSVKQMVQDYENNLYPTSKAIC